MRDFLDPFQPGDRLRLLADLVHELQPDSLPAGKHPPVVDGRQLGVGEPTPVFDQAFEPAVAVGDQRRERGADLGVVGSNPLGSALSGEDFTVSIFTPTLSRRPETSGY